MSVRIFGSLGASEQEQRLPAQRDSENWVLTHLNDLEQGKSQVT